MTRTRRLAAIVAADVAGYSRLIGADEEGTLNRLRSIRAEIIDSLITEHRGRIVKTTGDGLLVEFSSVVDALRCATQWQRGMAKPNTDVPPISRIEFRRSPGRYRRSNGLKRFRPYCRIATHHVRMGRLVALYCAKDA